MNCSIDTELTHMPTQFYLTPKICLASHLVTRHIYCVSGVTSTQAGIKFTARPELDSL